MANKRITYIGLGIISLSCFAGYVGLSSPSREEMNLVGSTLYQSHCAACHGKNLEGEVSNWQDFKEDGTLPAPPHDATGHTWHHDDQLLFDYTYKGGAAMTPADFKSAMPHFNDKLREDEIWSILSFIKSTWPQSIQEKQALINKGK
jgi:cytochrome c